MVAEITLLAAVAFVWLLILKAKNKTPNIPFIVIDLYAAIPTMCKNEQECAESLYDDSSQYTALSNLEKGSSWPSKAIPYGEYHIKVLVLIQATFSTPWT